MVECDAKIRESLDRCVHSRAVRAHTDAKRSVGGIVGSGRSGGSSSRRGSANRGRRSRNNLVETNALESTTNRIQRASFTVLVPIVTHICTSTDVAQPFERICGPRDKRQSRLKSRGGKTPRCESANTERPHTCEHCSPDKRERARSRESARAQCVCIPATGSKGALSPHTQKLLGKAALTVSHL